MWKPIQSNQRPSIIQHEAANPFDIIRYRASDQMHIVPFPFSSTDLLLMIFPPVDSASLTDPARVSVRGHGEYIVNRSYHRWNKNDAIARCKVWKSNVIWLSGVWGAQTYWRIFLSVCRQIVCVVAVQRDGCCTQRNILRKVRSDGPEYSDQLKNGPLRHAQNTPAVACFHTSMHSHISPWIHPRFHLGTSLRLGDSNSTPTEA